MKCYETFSDKHLFDLIQQEYDRQEQSINLIASENYVSESVMAATASVLTNKYAEGFPGKRYYAGCAVVDAVEALAQERCKQLFNAPYVNVQPHAGSQANSIAYHAFLKPGDTILGMRLSHGGHLTHGHAVNISGKMYNSIQYGVDEQTGLLAYDELERMAHEHRPQLIIAGASAYARTIDFERIARIARDVGAFFMADIAHIAGLVAVGLHPSPIACADVVTSTTHKTLRGPRGGLIMAQEQYAKQIDAATMPGMQGGPMMHVIAAKAVAFYEALQPDFKKYQQQIIANARAMAQTFIDLGYTIVTGGTDNHLFILDLRTKNITGREAERALEAVGITVSRSGIPGDQQPAWITSGIRLGTPAITTRGAQEVQAREIAYLVDEVLTNAAQGKPYLHIGAAVHAFTERAWQPVMHYQPLTK